MGLLTFKGGIHPNDGKSLAKEKAIVEVKPKGDLVYPVSQHIGAPAKPLVKKGDRVLAGQMIGEAGGFHLRQCPFLRIRHGKGSGAKACGKRPDGDERDRGKRRLV